MKVLITGISSAVGYYTAKAFIDQGWYVAGCSRSEPAYPLHGLKYHRVDITDALRVDQVVGEGYDMIVHIAALSSPWGKKQDFQRANVEATSYLLQAVLKHKVTRFIYISSPSIYFEYRDQFNIKEEACSNKPANHYALSKQQAEMLVHEAYEQGLETFILRPKAIFGPLDKVLMPRLLNALKQGGMPRFRKQDVILDMTYVENVAHAIICAAKADARWAGSAYNITNGKPQSLHKMVAGLVEKIGYTYRERHVPYAIAKGIAELVQYKAAITHKEPMFTPYSVGALTFSQTLCIDKARKELKYKPQVSLEEGIERYRRWYENGHL